jgi:hypothetical protein
MGTPGTAGAGEDSAARVAAELARRLAGQGVDRMYTAASGPFGVVSVTAELTAWTNGQVIWCTVRGQRYTWAAADIETAAARIAGLAGPADTS